ncbi:MAG: flagellin [Methanospirillum sp.]|uniref:hypothetical protein n=1 Tax=Methanospirillum sp. TaxID=45200 RepID=UPI002370555F|nr:hypothetical protein [Methanospirillum sp.]MDD1728700.1 flagellin [Methanospirillum sp.]
MSRYFLVGILLLLSMACFQICSAAAPHSDQLQTPSFLQVDGSPQIIRDAGENYTYIQIPVRLSAGSPEVDLSHIVMRIDTGTSLLILGYQKTGGLVYPDSGNWTVFQKVQGDSDDYLEYGELFDIACNVSGKIRETGKIQLEMLPVGFSSPTEMVETIPYHTGKVGTLFTTPQLPEKTNSLLTINGQCYGGWSNGNLTNLTISLAVPYSGNSSVDLTKAKIIWNNYSDAPVVLSSTSTSFTPADVLNPGDKTQMKIEIPVSFQKGAGKSFSVEIIPANCQPILILGTINSGYSGGLILVYWDFTSYNSQITYSGIKQSTSNLVLDGYLYGDGSPLTKLTFYLAVPEGGQAIDLSKVVFLYTVNDGEVQQLESGLSGTLAPGNRIQVTLNVNGPDAGETFTLEIKPPVGASSLIQRTLSSGYSGGVIY